MYLANGNYPRKYMTAPPPPRRCPPTHPSIPYSRFAPPPERLPRVFARAPENDGWDPDELILSQVPAHRSPSWTAARARLRRDADYHMEWSVLLLPSAHPATQMERRGASRRGPIVQEVRLTCASSEWHQVNYPTTEHKRNKYLMNKEQKL